MTLKKITQKCKKKIITWTVQANLEFLVFGLLPFNDLLRVVHHVFIVEHNKQKHRLLIGLEVCLKCGTPMST